MHDANERYGQLFNAMDEGVCIAEVLLDSAGVAVDHVILEANPAFTRHTGVSDPAGKHASELVPGGEQFWNTLYARVVRTGEAERVQQGSDVMQRWFDVFVTRVGPAAHRTVAIVFSDISARRATEQALSFRTAQFETLLNEAPFGVYLVDADFRLSALNPAAGTTFASIPDAIGRDFDEVMHTLWLPERADELVRRFRHTLVTGEAHFAPDDSVVSVDTGVQQYYTWQISRIPLPQGGHGVVCYFREISAQVLAREQLAQSEAQYRSVFDSAPMAVFTCDTDGLILSYNAFAERLWGTAPQRGVDMFRERFEFVQSDGSPLPPHRGPLGDVLSTGVPSHNQQLAIARPDGSLLPVLVNIAPLTGVNGQRSGTVTTFLDISERVRAEDALAATQRQMAFMMDSMPQKIFTAMPNASIDYLNQQWMEFTGLDGSAIRDWGRTELIHPDDLAQTVALWQRGFELGAPIEIEHRFRRADGEYRWHISRAMPMRDQRGDIVLWVGSSTDTHEQRRASEASHAAGVALVNADHLKDEFLAMLAHELRSPIAPIQNAVALLQGGREDSARVALAIDVIDRQSRQLVRLVDELLDVSRITRGTIQLRCERIDLGAVLLEALESSQPGITRAGLEIRVSLPEEPLFLHADSARLVQVFGNLLNNAGKYTERGGTIWLTAVRENNDAIVTVRDTGVGIPSHMLHKVFDLFTQVDPSLERSRDGLGIGLTLVQRLVSLHEGVVTAASDGPGTGSVFTVRLPALRTVDLTNAPAKSAAVSGQVILRRVLVVDDNQDSADTMSLLLQFAGHDTRVAYDGVDALAVAAEFRPHLVLMDIGMPRLNGYAAAQRIREAPWGRAMRLVALSGWGRDEDRARSLAAGFDRHMVKPVNQAELTELLMTSPSDAG